MRLFRAAALGALLLACAPGAEPPAVWVEPHTGMELVRIRHGTFEMLGPQR